MNEMKNKKNICLIICLFSILLLSNNSEARSRKVSKKLRLIGIKYFNKTYGHVHENPSSYSASETTIPCGYPVKVYLRRDSLSPKWSFVKAGDEYGYIEKRFLGDSRKDCLQAKYPKFFNNLALDLSDIYYWGKIPDQIIEGKSHAY
jgi:hypothetical protein